MGYEKSKVLHKVIWYLQVAAPFLFIVVDVVDNLDLDSKDSSKFEGK